MSVEVNVDGTETRIYTTDRPADVKHIVLNY